MKDYIYKITNILNDKCYIGKSVDPYKRFEQHCKADTTIGRAISKYGRGVFELSILEEVIHTSEDVNINLMETNSREIYYIDLYKSFGENGYNMTIGGDGFTSEQAYNMVMERVANGTHPLFLDENKESVRQYQNSLLENGVHNFQNENNRKSVSETQKELLKSGTHNWQNPETEIKRKELSRKAVSKSNQDRLQNGTHYLKSDKHKNLMKDVMTDRNSKMLSDGTHPQLQIHICPHCNKSGKGSVMFRHHFNNCHLNISGDKICGL